MDRAALEKLSRDDLILRAEQVGVERARILTRPELIDEILLSTLAKSNKRELKKARGFFGLARDLINRVVERGLHLPDAAERLRSLVPPPPTIARPTAGALPTVTLAEIYASQGHTERAIETLERVLAGEPEHAAAHALLAKLRANDYVAPPKPELPPEPDPSLVPPAIAKGEEDRPSDETDDVAAPADDTVQESLASILAIAKAAASELPPPPADEVPPVEDMHVPAAVAPAPPADLRVDALDAIPLENGRLAVHYAVSVDSLARSLVDRRDLAIRVLRYYADPAGTRRVQTDLPISDREGHLLLADLPNEGCTRVALGSVDARGDFRAIAHASLVERSSSRDVSQWSTRPTIALDRKVSRPAQPSI